MQQPIQIVELLQGRSKLELGEVLEWGGAVLDEVYGGEPNAWRSGDSMSLRRLAEAAGVSVSTLYRYVAVAAMWRECGEPKLSHLGISHLRQFLPLPHAVQTELIGRAERERWTVAETRRIASLHQRRPEVVGRGRPPRVAGYRAALRHIERWMKSDDRLEGLEDVEDLCESEANSLLRVIRLARMELEMVEVRIATVNRS